MVDDDNLVTGLLLARGLLEAYENILDRGVPVRQDDTMPQQLRRALERVTRTCILEGADDFGASVHAVMDKACEPLGTWGLKAFEPPYRYADAVLIDRPAGVPTDDCRAMAAEAGSESAALENIHHERLRGAVSGFGAAKNAAYSRIRGFVVRNPAVSRTTLNQFLLDENLVAAADAVRSFYRPVPQAALFDGRARRCANCGALLWPDRDLASFPEGRCRVRMCRLDRPHPAPGDGIDDPASWLLATDAVLAYWVGPGIDEIRLHDALAAAGRRAVLYPEADAADVGVDGFAVGIDVKGYSSPVVLGAKLSLGIGRLDLFSDRILAVSDCLLRTNRDYLRQLRAAYTGGHGLRFMTVSDALAELTR